VADFHEACSPKLSGFICFLFTCRLSYKCLGSNYDVSFPEVHGYTGSWFNQITRLIYAEVTQALGVIAAPVACLNGAIFRHWKLRNGISCKVLVKGPAYRLIINPAHISNIFHWFLGLQMSNSPSTPADTFLVESFQTYGIFLTSRPSFALPLTNSHLQYLFSLCETHARSIVTSSVRI
jgi:hypothetical protein